MLNKAICRKCLEHCKIYWDSVKEFRWDRGYISCILDTVMRVEVNGDPPDDCPYLLEHLLESQNVK